MRELVSARGGGWLGPIRGELGRLGLLTRPPSPGLYTPGREATTQGKNEEIGDPIQPRPSQPSHETREVAARGRCQGGNTLVGLQVAAQTGVIIDPPTWSSRGAGPKARLDHLSLWSVKGSRPADR